MVNNGRTVIDKTNEMRTKEISSMISEGGLGAENYYNVKKRIPKEERDKQTLTSVVNQLIANQGVLFVKFHQFHWHVQGPHFFTLHDQFEALYQGASEYLDAFAERLIAKHERPLSTLSEYLASATISENVYSKHIDAEDMVREVVEDLQTVKSLTNEAIDLADDEDDDVTEDMLIAYVEYLDEKIWMLSAFLG